MAENYYNSSLSGAEMEKRLIGGVLFNETMNLTESERQIARRNIGAGTSDAGFVIKGYYSTIAALQTAHPEGQAGDNYGVGNADPYDIYSWDAVNETWVNNGPIVGENPIDDLTESTQKTWSSRKISGEIDGAGVRPNLTTNWYFAGSGSQAGIGQFPINSVGGGVSTPYTPTTKYNTIDAWYLNADYPNTVEVSLLSSGLKVKTTAASVVHFHFYQVLRDFTSLAGQKITLSAIIADHHNKTVRIALGFRNSSGGLVGTNLYISGDNYTTGVRSVTGTIPANTNHIVVGIYNATESVAGDYITIAAIKVELGEGQTLATSSGLLKSIPNWYEERYKCYTWGNDSQDPRSNMPVQGFSPLKSITSNYVLNSLDAGKTLYTNGTNLTILVSTAYLSAMPTGSEIGIVHGALSSSNYTTLQFEGYAVRANINGVGVAIAETSTPGAVKFNQWNLVGLKKLGATAFLVTGNVEVVT